MRNSIIECVSTVFYCNICKENHKIEVPITIKQKATSFPFQYIYFHGTRDNIMSNLYIDADFKVRGAESFNLDSLETNFITRNKSLNIIRELAKQLKDVRREYKILNERFNDLNEKYLALKFEFFCLEKEINENKNI